VIEHVIDPLKIMRAVKRLLRPRGIALIFTPNLDSFGFNVLGGYSSLVTPAEHLYYFTFESFKRLCDGARLEIVRFETRGMDIPDIFSYYRDDLKQAQVAEFLELNCAALQATIDSAGCANHMRFVVTAA